MKFVFHSMVVIVAVVMVALAVSYLPVKHYDFPKPKPFTGSQWYNPYENTSDSLIKANFHAHNHCWWGLTFGEDTEQEIVEAYLARGYHLPGISNYQSIGRYFEYDPMYVPLYEHGLNVKKVHCLSIGSRDVSWTIFPVHFNWHQKQQEIEATRHVSDLTGIAHPEGGRYALRDLRRLGGYHLMEVGNTLNISTDKWDMALSAGKLSWILSNDDMHSLQNEEKFMRWTHIYVANMNRNGVIRALAQGRSVGVASYDGLCEDNRIKSFTLSGDTIRLIMRDTANRIDMFGQDGVQKATSARSNTLTYVLQPSDTYVRTEVHGDHCVVYLNPVVRWDGHTLPFAQVPRVNWTVTWFSRMAFLLLIFGVLSGVYWMTVNSTIQQFNKIQCHTTT